MERKTFCKANCGRDIDKNVNIKGYCVRHENYEANQKKKADREKKRREENMKKRQKKYEYENIRHAIFMEHETKRLKAQYKPQSPDFWKDYAKTTFGIDLDNLESPEAKAMFEFINLNTAVEIKMTPREEEMFRSHTKIRELEEQIRRQQAIIIDNINENMALRNNSKLSDDKATTTPSSRDLPSSTYGPLSTNNVYPLEYMRSVNINSSPVTTQQYPITEPSNPIPPPQDAPSSRIEKMHRMIKDHNTSSEEDPDNDSEDNTIQIESGDEILVDTEKLRLTGSPPHERLHQLSN